MDFLNAIDWPTVINAGAQGVVGGAFLATLCLIYVLLRYGVNFIVDSVAALFGKGPRAHATGETDHTD